MKFLNTIIWHSAESLPTIFIFKGVIVCSDHFSASPRNLSHKMIELVVESVKSIASLSLFSSLLYPSK